MPAAQAVISTSRAAAYLTRLCGHAAKMGAATNRLHHRRRAHASGAPPQVQQVQRDGDEAILTLDCGQWTLHAAPSQLSIRAQAPGQDSLQRIQDLLTHRLLTLARREQLTITWHPAPDPEEPVEPAG